MARYRGDGDRRYGDTGGVRVGVARRLPMDHLKPFSLAECGTLTFEEPDFERFPCLRLSYDALRAGGTMPACLNAANEELVAAFLAGHRAVSSISRVISRPSWKGIRTFRLGPSRMCSKLTDWARRGA